MGENERLSENILIDCPPGSGKTTYCINLINSSPDHEKTIYITPFKSEVERIVEQCKGKNFVQPDVKNGKGRKSAHLLELIRHGTNIASTHSLFAEISDEVIEELRKNNYTLYLDETFNIIKQFDMFKEFDRMDEDIKEQITIAEIETLLRDGLLALDEDFRIRWIRETEGYNKYLPLRVLCDRSMLYFVDHQVLMWAFPSVVFRSVFNKVYVITYQFDFQLQKAFFDYHDIRYTKYHVESRTNERVLVKTTDNEYEIDFIKNIKPKFHIYENRKFSFNKKTALCVSWYWRDSGKLQKKIDPDALEGSDENENINIERMDNDNLEVGKKIGLKRLKGYMETFFRYHADGATASAKEIMWTTIMEYVEDLMSSRVPRKSHLAMNLRATNDHINKKAIAYMVNRFIRPHYRKFFQKRNIGLDQDGFALSEMLQFVFRSRIREGKDIYLFIPSLRMRQLLKDYLDGKILS